MHQEGNAIIWNMELASPMDRDDTYGEWLHNHQSVWGSLAEDHRIAESKMGSTHVHISIKPEPRRQDLEALH